MPVHAQGKKFGAFSGCIPSPSYYASCLHPCLNSTPHLTHDPHPIPSHPQATAQSAAQNPAAAGTVLAQTAAAANTQGTGNAFAQSQAQALASASGTGGSNALAQAIGQAISSGGGAAANVYTNAFSQAISSGKSMSNIVRAGSSIGRDMSVGSV